MTHFRFLPVSAALLAAGALIGCNTMPGAMPMRSAHAQGTAPPHPMGEMSQMDTSKMDAQMKKMREMHEKMTAAKTPEERSKLMAEHMRTMQDSMQMMGSMSGMHGGGMSGMQHGGSMGAMPGGAMSGGPVAPGAADARPMPGRAGGMHAHHQMMEKRIAMMESMMQMMMDRMPAQPAR